MLESGLTKQTALHVYRVIHATLNDAIKDKLVGENPAALADPPKVQGKKYRRRVRSFSRVENVSPCHSWRHTSASILWAATKDVKAIQERLGHSDPAITSALYIHNAPTADEAAAEVLGGLIRR
jgi:integrase